MRKSRFLCKMCHCAPLDFLCFAEEHGTHIDYTHPQQVANTTLPRDILKALRDHNTASTDSTDSTVHLHASHSCRFAGKAQPEQAVGYNRLIIQMPSGFRKSLSGKKGGGCCGAGAIGAGSVVAGAAVEAAASLLDAAFSIAKKRLR